MAALLLPEVPPGPCGPGPVALPAQHRGVGLLGRLWAGPAGHLPRTCRVRARGLRWVPALTGRWARSPEGRAWPHQQRDDLCQNTETGLCPPTARTQDTQAVGRGLSRREDPSPRELGSGSCSHGGFGGSRTSSGGGPDEGPADPRLTPTASQSGPCRDPERHLSMHGGVRVRAWARGGDPCEPEGDRDPCPLPGGLLLNLRGRARPNSCSRPRGPRRQRQDWGLMSSGHTLGKPHGGSEGWPSCPSAPSRPQSLDEGLPPAGNLLRSHVYGWAGASRPSSVQLEASALLTPLGVDTAQHPGFYFSSHTELSRQGNLADSGSGSVPDGGF